MPKGIEKTRFPIPFTLNGIWSLLNIFPFDFLNQMESKGKLSLRGYWFELVAKDIARKVFVLIYRLVVFKFIQFCIALSSTINILILYSERKRHSRSQNIPTSCLSVNCPVLLELAMIFIARWTSRVYYDGFSNVMILYALIVWTSAHSFDSGNKCFNHSCILWWVFQRDDFLCIDRVNFCTFIWQWQ